MKSLHLKFRPEIPTADETSPRAAAPAESRIQLWALSRRHRNSATWPFFCLGQGMRARKSPGVCSNSFNPLLPRHPASSGGCFFLGDEIHTHEKNRKNKKLQKIKSSGRTNELLGQKHKNPNRHTERPTRTLERPNISSRILDKGNTITRRHDLACPQIIYMRKTRQNEY